MDVVSCTYHQWFNPYSKTKAILPVSRRRMQRFLQFRLASHNLPIVTGRFSGGQHVDRASRVCVHCGGLSIAGELHMMRECPASQPLGPKTCQNIWAKSEFLLLHVSTQQKIISPIRVLPAYSQNPTKINIYAACQTQYLDG